MYIYVYIYTYIHIYIYIVFVLEQSKNEVGQPHMRLLYTNSEMGLTARSQRNKWIDTEPEHFSEMLTCLSSDQRRNMISLACLKRLNHIS